MSPYLGAVLFGIFVFVSLFGLPALLSHPDHHMGCPLQGAQTVMCENTIIEHVSMWQTMFASVVSLLIVCIAGLAVVGTTLMHALDERLRIRVPALVSHRPLVLQELYSNGIHNRKEPYIP